MTNKPYKSLTIILISNHNTIDSHLHLRLLSIMTHLAQIKLGERALIKGFLPSNATYRRKLMAMGLHRGVEFLVLYMAPLGDPVGILVQGAVLSLRASEADILDLERVVADA